MLLYFFRALVLKKDSITDRISINNFTKDKEVKKLWKKNKQQR